MSPVRNHSSKKAAAVLSGSFQYPLVIFGPRRQISPAFSRGTTNGSHWLLDEEGNSLPVTLIDGAGSGRMPAVVILLDDLFPTRIEAARFMWHAMTGHPRGRTPDTLTAQQRSKLKLILRGLDGRLADCSYRTIAEVLYDCAFTGIEWKTHELHGRIRRLCRRGFDLMHGEYRDLLRHPRQLRI